MKNLTVRTVCKVDLSMDESTGMIFPLTPCCAASGKGSVAIDGYPVVVCRKCYTEVGENYGMSSMLASGLPETLEAFGCPCAEACADETVWHFELAKQDQEMASLSAS